MTRPHPTLAEPPAITADALSGADGTADPRIASPMTEFFADATADVVIRRLPKPATTAAAAAMGASDTAATAVTVAVAPVAVAGAGATFTAAGLATAPASVVPVAAAPHAGPARPGLAPRRPAGVAPERLAVQRGRGMPQRYPAPQYSAAPQFPGQFPPPHVQGAARPGQWPPPAPPGVRTAPPPARRPAPARPAAASYPQAQRPRTSHPQRLPGTAPKASRAAAGWATFVGILVVLVVSGAGREVLDAIAELLNR